MAIIERTQTTFRITTARLAVVAAVLVVFAIFAGFDFDGDRVWYALTSWWPKSCPPVERVATEPPEYYEAKLTDKDFRWHGPTSSEERIPILDAALALAYIGDPAVPALLRAAEHEPFADAKFDRDYRVSITDALSEIGLPMHEFHGMIETRNIEPLRTWWENNRLSTLSKRSERRLRIGLPPIEME